MDDQELDPIVIYKTNPSTHMPRRTKFNGNHCLQSYDPSVNKMLFLNV